ncbi:MAG: hypothetical protein IJL80_00865 [Treponema sp.]|nr:hypothetical protein [Treponema sp.]
MTGVSFAQVEAQLPFFSEQQLKSIANTVSQLLSRPSASQDPFYSESNMLAIDKSLKELEEGKVIVKTMEQLEAMANG